MTTHKDFPGTSTKHMQTQNAHVAATTNRYDLCYLCRKEIHGRREITSDTHLQAIYGFYN